MKCYRLPGKDSRSRLGRNRTGSSDAQLGNQLGGGDGTLQLSKVESICSDLGDRQHLINTVITQLHTCFQEVGAGSLMPLSGCAATLAPEVTDDMEDVPFAPIKTNRNHRRTVS